MPRVDSRLGRFIYAMAAAPPRTQAGSAGSRLVSALAAYPSPIPTKPNPVKESDPESHYARLFKSHPGIRNWIPAITSGLAVLIIMLFGSIAVHRGENLPVPKYPTISLKASIAVGSVDAVAIGPARNGHSTIAAQMPDGTVRLWDVESDHAIGPLSDAGSAVTLYPPVSMVFSPDGRFLATGSTDNIVSLWDVATGYKITSIIQAEATTGLSYSADGKTLAIASYDGAVALWKADDPYHPVRKLVLPAQTGPINCLAFTADGRLLATGGADSAVILWDTATGDNDGTYGGAGVPASLAFSPDGKTLAVGNKDGIASLWPVTGPAEDKMTINPQAGPVAGLTFDPAGQVLATAGTNGTVAFWDLSARKSTRLSRFGTVRDPVTAPVFSDDGRELVIGRRDGSVQLWDINTS